MEAYRNFVKGKWCDAIDVADFIRHNYTPYTGDESFLAGPTPRTKKLNAVLEGLQKLERENGGVLGIDTDTVSSLLAYPPAYMDKENELIVGLQTGAPLVRTIMITNPTATPTVLILECSPVCASGISSSTTT